MGQQLTLRHVQKKYGPIWAVQDTNLEVKAGEFVSIVGPSGSGKTSLLTMIAGFEAPTAGAIFVGSQDVTSLAPHRRNIGMVFQKYALFPHMTVRQNIAFPLKMRRLAEGSAVNDRINAMLDLVQLGALQNRYPHELSGGQQQRVAVARALVFDPPVILMDEPLGALDKKLRESMQIEIKQIQERIGATVIYVTHDQEEALTMSDRVAVMRGGRLEQVGTPIELYKRPRSAFIADFVGSINFIPGTVCQTSGSSLTIRCGATILEICPTNMLDMQPPENGSPVRLGVRPEHLEIETGSVNSRNGRDTTSFRSRPDVPGGFCGTVETIVFAGASRIALIRVDAASDVVLRASLPAQLGELPERGAKVSLRIAPDTALVFDGH
ncbi:ABC transporter ATP-binding protein [Rhizobium glycinendophyticum]|uniref:ABC transporter ATP-binding protein n=1 Tax=Rhizobium glycinendophyticum TaxID=2589807 RepID=A0A504TR27_9HYPH|nr:ABC transporter ATP-binding protein [Rhizobium glycinendophyticum]TPP04589.1 ABC transporter ATP-binding protein [Rhizobium glycinendophyticum]